MKEPSGTDTQPRPSVGVRFQTLLRGFTLSAGMGRGSTGRPGPGLEACCVISTVAHLLIIRMRSGMSHRPGSFPSSPNSPWRPGLHFGVREHSRQKVNDQPLWGQQLPYLSEDVDICRVRNPKTGPSWGIQHPGESLDKSASGPGLLHCPSQVAEPGSCPPLRSWSHLCFPSRPSPTSAF